MEGLFSLAGVLIGGFLTAFLQSRSRHQSREDMLRDLYAHWLADLGELLWAMNPDSTGPGPSFREITVTHTRLQLVERDPRYLSLIEWLDDAVSGLKTLELEHEPDWPAIDAAEQELVKALRLRTKW